MMKHSKDLESYIVYNEEEDLEKDNNIISYDVIKKLSKKKIKII